MGSPFCEKKPILLTAHDDDSENASRSQPEIFEETGFEAHGLKPRAGLW